MARHTAQDQALKFAFFTSAEDPNHTYGSLRPMLHAGKRCGAFDLPRGKGGVPKPTEMDTHLFSLRDRIHAKPSQGDGGVVKNERGPGHGEAPNVQQTRVPRTM